MIGMILEGVAAATTNEQGGKLCTTSLLARTAARQSLDYRMMSRPSESTLPVRFFCVMRAHGLSFPDVVDLLSEFGFTLSALGDTARLVSLLTPSTLQYIAEVFDVRLEWLAAGAERATCRRPWTSEDLHRQLTAEHVAGREPSVTLVRGVEAAHTYGMRVPEFAVVRREHGARARPQFVTLQVWHFHRWQPDAQLAECDAVAAICERTQTQLAGVELPGEVLGGLSLGRELPIQLLGCLIPRRWHPRANAARGLA
jgi:hypothetical protein